MKYLLLVLSFLTIGCAIAKISDDGKKASIFGVGKFSNETESIESKIISFPDIKLGG